MKTSFKPPHDDASRPYLRGWLPATNANARLMFQWVSPKKSRLEVAVHSRGVLWAPRDAPESPALARIARIVRTRSGLYRVLLWEPEGWAWSAPEWLDVIEGDLVDGAGAPYRAGAALDTGDHVQDDAAPTLRYHPLP